jgi:DNA polymerase III subunit beta
MHFTTQREVLLKPVSFVAGIVERRQTLPILANVLIELDTNKLTLTGTDLEVEVVTETEVNGKKNGKITVPARKLLDICKTLPNETKIDFSLNKEKVVIKAGRSRFSLTTLSPNDFPNLETENWDQDITLKQQVLKALLEKTQFCMAQQDVRYYLNGLLLEIKDKILRAVATDGHRMATSNVPLEQKSTEERQVIVPRKGVLEISRLLESNENKVKLQLNPNHLRIIAPDFIFTTKLIDGRFPDYNKVIPAEQNKKVQIDRDTLKEALIRVAILSNEKYRGVRFNFDKGSMKVTAHNPEQEEAQEELSVQYSGDSIEIGFNVNYVSDAVSALSAGNVEIGLSDANSSCTLRTPKDKTTQYIVMPMRL